VSDEVSVGDVRFEHHREGFGIGEARPRISWKVSADQSGWLQRAYELRLVDPENGSAWSSGRIESEHAVLVPWPAPPLASRQKRAVSVRVWGMRAGAPSEWSDPALVEAALLERSDWTAEFITPDRDEDRSADRPPWLFRRDFHLAQDIESARLYITAHGVYEAEINGARVGDHVLAPGWTSYRHRLRYQAFDVTSLLHAGANCIGAIVGDGWFRGQLGYRNIRNVYGDRLALLAQLEIRYADGGTQRVVTDDLWRAEHGPIRSSGIYAGEAYDARKERPGWSSPGHADGDWAGVLTLARDAHQLVAPAGPPVRHINNVAPVKIHRSPSGKTIVDFGQNLVGRLRITLNGAVGTTVTLRHAEVLQDGEVYTRPLRAAAATDRYTLRGGGREEWEPRFTYHGFRYVEVDGWPGQLSAENLVARVCHTDMERTGWFSCSDPDLSQLHENVVWSMRGNFFDIPTDCPQRDERLGWTGDLQVFAPTASYLYDCAGMLTSWLADLAVEQLADGVPPFYVPYVGLNEARPVAAWGDAAVIVPWVLFQRFADRGLLAAQYPSMKAWVDTVAGIAGDGCLWQGEALQLGDWLDPSAPGDGPWAAATDPYLVANAYFAHSASLLASAAEILGHDQDAEKYGRLAAWLRRAWNTAYATEDGLLASDTQTAYALALQFGLLAGAGQLDAARQRLRELVAKSGFRIATGFVGTPIICDALTAADAVDTAYRLLFQREPPSWLYPVTQGATTVWERWDSLMPDGRVNPAEMTSFNHYALGAVADWLHRTVAGLAPAAPGYRRISISPRPGGGLTYASARHETPYGTAEVRWVRNGGRLDLDILVPAGTTAEVRLPGDPADLIEVGSGKHRFSCAYPAPAEDGQNTLTTQRDR
jgi:alpha-L-rhamnosidase